MAILRANKSEVYTKCIYTMTLNLRTGQLLDIKVDMVVTCQAELTQGAHMASSIGAASIMSPIISSPFPGIGTFGISGRRGRMSWSYLRLLCLVYGNFSHSSIPVGPQLERPAGAWWQDCWSVWRLFLVFCVGACGQLKYCSEPWHCFRVFSLAPLCYWNG